MTRLFAVVVPRAALAVLGIVVAVGIVEVALRVLHRGDPTLRGLHELRPDRPWLYGLRPGAAMTEGGVQYVVNRDGFRDYDYTRPKPPGTFRVVVLGDSIVFGWGVALDDTFAKLLEARLRALAPGRPIDVLSLGVSGYNPYTEAALLRDVGITYEPDLVVVAFCINDLNDPTLHFDASTAAALRDIPPDAFPDPNRRAAPPGWCSRLRVCALVTDTLTTTNRAATLRAVEPHDDPPPRDLAWLRARYAEMASAAAAAGARVAIVVFPYAWQVERDRPGRIQEHLAALAHAAGWPLVDLLPAFRAAYADHAEPLFLDIYHPTAAGHRVAAASMLAALGCDGLLPAGCPSPP